LIQIKSGRSSPMNAYQRQGIEAAFMRDLARLARDAELKEMLADALPKNNAMLKVLSKFASGPAPNESLRSCI